MNEQPAALWLADALMEPVVLDKHAMQAAAELRRLHELHELYQDKTQRQQNRITTLEAALRQAVEALELAVKLTPDVAGGKRSSAIAAVKQVLGEV